MNGDVSFVSARTKEDVIVMLDESDDAEGAEISQIRNLMVDFRLNEEGELQLKEFGESCRDSILDKAYPRLTEAMIAATMTPAGGPTAERKAMIRSAVEEERTRPLKPGRAPQPATDAAKELQKKMGASAAYANRAVKEMASGLLDKIPTTGTVRNRVKDKTATMQGNSLQLCK